MTRCGERATEKIHHASEQGVHRYLGLSLGGAKSEKTCLTVLDFYRKHNKAFVIDIYEGMGSSADQNADDVLLHSILEAVDEISDQIQSSTRVLAVDAPLTYPPCLVECDDSCQGYEKCHRSEVRWMNQQYRKASEKNKKLKHITPYSQRPVDLYFRYKYKEPALFQDETMGANLAPLACRMNYLKRHLVDVHLIEIWPKLSLFCNSKELKLNKHQVLGYRDIEEGAAIREHVIEKIMEKSNVFIYERDRKKTVPNINAFDSFLCAWAAMMYDLGCIQKFKSDLPLESGWIQIPEI